MPIVRLAIHAMATRFELVLDGDDDVALRAAGEEALEAIAETERRLSLFDPGSLVTRLNTRGAQRPVTMDDDMLDLLELCRDVHRDSDGAFDITVAALMEAWGFRDTGASRASALRTRDTGMECIAIDRAEGTAGIERFGVRLDLGGIGKGVALDAAADVLREHEVPRALLHGGTSSVVAIGRPPGLGGWGVAIGPAPWAATLRDTALSVSAPSGRTTVVDGERVGHVIDPRRRRPVRGVRVTAVVAPTATLADAWSTALVVLGARPARMPANLNSLVIDNDSDAVTTGGIGLDVFEAKERVAI
ncbi:MAG: FAD:protein FMN transferase [Planctomycetes bacterium]|nr:FAD:protein FMN transferase [Planctomycetota bacterium]